ncbi:tetratricopeptide repeat-containing glycosyltransferase family 2 protein [Mycobacterium palustre]|nr:glycosyltransferase [Mycobacterium palustre]
MIVKNEEETLERCLKSVDGIPDEIVIVDTGSEDNTKAIAGKFTSRVFDFEWIDDFSAARNFAFAQAAMDYTLWLDADDVLLPEDRDKLLQLKNTLSPTVDAVSMIYHYSFDESRNVTQSNRRFRLVKTSKKFAWVGVVHEDLVAPDTYTYFDSDIVVTHEKPCGGPTSSLRNRQIYERHLAAGRPLNPVDLCHYARELEAHGEFEKAIPYFVEFLAWQGSGDDAQLDLSLFALHTLARCYYMTGDLDKEWECALKSLELDVPRPEFSCRFAERFLKKNHFRQAIFWYELALQDPAAKSTREWGVQNYPFKTWLPHKQLGLCYYRIGDYKRSLHHNELARRYLPEDQDIETNIRLLQRLINESAGEPQAVPTDTTN